MTVTVKNKTPLVVPPAVRRRAGLKTGVITIFPKLPSGDDEYTPAQRRIIDRGIVKGLEDIKKGRVHGPFETADEAIAHLKAHARRRKRAAPHK
jgi:hypothetical protein